MISFLKRLSVTHKNSKFLYYSRGYIRLLFPGWWFRRKLKNKLTNTDAGNTNYIEDRVNYYNKLHSSVALAPDAISITNLKHITRFNVYFFDTYEYIRYFDPTYKANFLFGDITHIPDSPSLVKSRPISDHNNNSVLLKLNKVRHFIFVNDKKPFEEKLNRLVGRGSITQPHRIDFFKKYFTHSLCDIGQINTGTNYDNWIKVRLTIPEQLNYKFILCLEGNDVASNLKWVMSSNSLAVMPKPKYETWFMEGKLIPDHHYVCIRDDYSNLEERMSYYINHPEEANTIIKNANAFVEQFKDKPREDVISLRVLEKYFDKTRQITKSNA